MNFVFDIGNVLLTFTPRPFLESLYDELELVNRLKAVIYDSPEWVELDRGVIEPAEAERRFIEREPELGIQIRNVMARLPEMMQPIEPTIALLPRIVARGHKLYYLSNYHRDLSRIILRKHRFFDLFEGGVFSCDVLMVKPEPGIYRRFLEQHGLNASDCVFFDDTQANVDGANRAGIRGVLFRDAADVEKRM